jgi:hypothetical protein
VQVNEFRAKSEIRTNPVRRIINRQRPDTPNSTDGAPHERMQFIKRFEAGKPYPAQRLIRFFQYRRWNFPLVGEPAPARQFRHGGFGDGRGQRFLHSVILQVPVLGFRVVVQVSLNDGLERIRQLLTNFSRVT